MCKKSLLTELSDFLSDHIKETEKEKDLLLKEHYSENVEEGMDVEDFFREYTSAISLYLNTSKVNISNNAGCPFVIIGSIVEVQDMDDLETYQYCIVPPYSKNADMGIDNASCLSPLGKALLLKSINQQVKIEIPTGTLRYIIKKITIPDQLISKHRKLEVLNDTPPQLV